MAYLLPHLNLEESASSLLLSHFYSCSGTLNQVYRGQEGADFVNS